MPSQNVPHLCGGILFDLLLETRKARKKTRDRAKGGTDSLSDTDVYVGLAHIVTGENLSSSVGDTLKKCVSNYKKCENSKGVYVPFTNEVTQSTFDSEYNKKSPAILERTARFIEQYLSLEKCKWLVKALIEVMQKDPVISQDTEIATDFEESMPVSKLHEAKNIRFMPFFISVLHYVIDKCPDCESGRPTFEAWYCQTTPKAPWKFRPDVLSKIGSTIGNIEVSVDLGFPDVLAKKAAECRNSDSTLSTDENSPEYPDKNYSNLSSEFPLSKHDTRLLTQLMKDFNAILKFSKDTDLTITPMHSDLPEIFDCVFDKWKDRDTDFKKTELNVLKYDILNTLSDYFDFWGCHLWFDYESGYYVHKKSLSADAWKIEEELRQRVVNDRKASIVLYERLCQYIMDFDIDIDEAEPIGAKVVDDTSRKDAQGKSQVTIIQNQTNIAHSESKTFNIKDSNVTIND